jgi:hypothetical protein
MSGLGHVLSILGGIALGGWALLRLLLRLNRLFASGHAPRVVVWTLMVLLFLALSATGLYVFGEFVTNKGPDDWGAMWHAGYPLAAKYGKFEQTSYSMNVFDKDPDGSGSGTYHVHYVYNGHSGVILCHYDKATHKFDHDEIEPNP